MNSIRITPIGGPTALTEVNGFRLLTDPTFDAPGDYPLPHVTLKKTGNPALTIDQVLPVDAVLLSHDQHSDNLDTSGMVGGGQRAVLFGLSIAVLFAIVGTILLPRLQARALAHQRVD